MLSFSAHTPTFMTSEMKCNCPTYHVHLQRANAYLCGPVGETLTDLSDSPPGAKAGATAGAKAGRSNERMKRRHTKTRVFQGRSSFPEPIFKRSPYWHLSNGVHYKTGYSGNPHQMADRPHIPEMASADDRLAILTAAGYEVVEQHR